MSLLNQTLNQTFEAQRNELARAIVDEQWRQNPELANFYGESGRAKCEEDVNYNLSYLAQAMAADSQSLFVQYIAWVKSLFEGLNIPSADLVASLEITADILQQRFPDEIGSLAGKYIEAGLHQLAQPVITSSSFIDPDQPLAELAQHYLAALLRGERAEASHLILDAVESGASVKDIYMHVFQPSQREVGRLWQMNQVSVAQEHYCTAATQLIMSQLYPHIFSTERVDRRMVAACVGHELHELGLRMVADFFEMEGWDTYYLGSNMPARSIVAALADRQADLLTISATMTFHVNLVSELIDQVRATDSVGGVKILVGGYPFNIEPQLWRQVGANGYASDAQEAITMANTLISNGN